MARIEKIIQRLLQKPPVRDFTWDELIKVLNYFGFTQMAKGKTGGSRRKFVNTDNVMISLHEPHPRNELKTYQMEQIITVLKEEHYL